VALCWNSAEAALTLQLLRVSLLAHLPHGWHDVQHARRLLRRRLLEDGCSARGATALGVSGTCWQHSRLDDCSVLIWRTLGVRFFVAQQTQECPAPAVVAVQLSLAAFGSIAFPSALAYCGQSGSTKYGGTPRRKFQLRLALD
jgi:hypothetical protein